MRGAGRGLRRSRARCQSPHNVRAPSALNLLQEIGANVLHGDQKAVVRSIAQAGAGTTRRRSLVARIRLHAHKRIHPARHSQRRAFATALHTASRAPQPVARCIRSPLALSDRPPWRLDRSTICRYSRAPHVLASAQHLSLRETSTPSRLSQNAPSRMRHIKAKMSDVAVVASSCLKKCSIIGTLADCVVLRPQTNRSPRSFHQRTHTSLMSYNHRNVSRQR